MSRLIDVDALRIAMDSEYPFDKVTQSKHDAFDVAKGVILMIINEQPIVHDGAEIVHCCDCRHYRKDSDKCWYCDRIDYGYGFKPDDFCSRAGRRGDVE